MSLGNEGATLLQELIEPAGGFPLRHRRVFRAFGRGPVLLRFVVRGFEFGQHLGGELLQRCLIEILCCLAEVGVSAATGGDVGRRQETAHCLAHGGLDLIDFPASISCPLRQFLLDGDENLGAENVLQHLSAIFGSGLQEGGR